MSKILTVDRNGQAVGGRHSGGSDTSSGFCGILSHGCCRLFLACFVLVKSPCLNFVVRSILKATECSLEWGTSKHFGLRVPVHTTYSELVVIPTRIVTFNHDAVGEIRRGYGYPFHIPNLLWLGPGDGEAVYGGGGDLQS